MTNGVVVGLRVTWCVRQIRSRWVSQLSWKVATHSALLDLDWLVEYQVATVKAATVQYRTIRLLG